MSFKKNLHFFQQLQNTDTTLPKKQIQPKKLSSTSFLQLKSIQEGVALSESKSNPIVEEYITIHKNFDSIPTSIVLLIGQTGGGKSSISNAIIGEYKCKESSKLSSCTDEIMIISGKWYGKRDTVTVVDTPGFLDSENRDSSFITEIIDFLERFPKNKLGVLVITLPLTENRAKSSYMQMIDQIELLFGEKIWENTIFVTTLENQLKITREALDLRKKEWYTWLTGKCCIENPKMCNFIYSIPESIDAIRSMQLSNKPCTPQTSEKIHKFLEGNPYATVDQIVENVTNLKNMQVMYEENLKAAIREKERYKKLESASNAESKRLQSKLKNYESEIQVLKQKLNTPVPTVQVHHHHHHCCFPKVAKVSIEGQKNKIMLEDVKEGDRLLSINKENEIVYSEVYFAFGKDIKQGSFYSISYKNSLGIEKSIELTADHVIFVSEVYDLDISNVSSLVAEKVNANHHYIWIYENGVLSPKLVTNITLTNNDGLYTILVKDHRLLVDDVLVSAYEISHSWGIIDTIPMRFLYAISPSFVASSYNKLFCEYYDRIVEGTIKSIRSVLRFFYPSQLHK